MRKKIREKSRKSRIRRKPSEPCGEGQVPEPGDISEQLDAEPANLDHNKALPIGFTLQCTEVLMFHVWTTSTFMVCRIPLSGPASQESPIPLFSMRQVPRQNSKFITLYST
eukprot:Phypoly_transcript_06607.p5 GENE.Phypoly_transcript_06607~~Phypoly_transcript_06607.p5  ORF type:complete len:111 (+),score=4.73 Phypoly_transcript_06607:1293-1625(+)